MGWLSTKSVIFLGVLQPLAFGYTAESSCHPAEAEAREGDECVAMQMPTRRSVDIPVMPHMPKPKVAFGHMISEEEWKSEWDFTVKLRINGFICTGSGWGDMVLTAAHCVEDEGRIVSPEEVQVITAQGEIRVYDVRVHPKRMGKAYDYALLGLVESMVNNKNMVLRTEEDEPGDERMLSGLGVTSEDDENPMYPSLPVLTNRLEVVDCNGRVGPVCIGSGPNDRQSSCGGDSGGPWLHTAGNTAVVSGVNSFGYGGGCGEPGKMTGYWSTHKAKEWIEAVAPGHFQWDTQATTAAPPRTTAAECWTPQKYCDNLVGHRVFSCDNKLCQRHFNSLEWTFEQYCSAGVCGHGNDNPACATPKHYCSELCDGLKFRFFRSTKCKWQCEANFASVRRTMDDFCVHGSCLRATG